MTDLKFTSQSGETTLKFEDTGRIGTVSPKTQLHIKMDEPVKYETPMTKSIIVAKVPDTYTADQKNEIENSIQCAVKKTQILVLPNEVEVFSLPLED